MIAEVSPFRCDGVLALLSDGGESRAPAQSLVNFCDGRRLSLRSRIELAEHVCSLVCAAHDSGSGFLRISAHSVTVEYVEGSLSIDIPGSIEIPRQRDGDRVQRDGSRFNSSQLIRAANVVELGQLLAEITGTLAHFDRNVARVVERATSMLAGERLESVHALRDEITRLRRAREACSSSTPALAKEGADRSFAQRWSWAD